MAGPANEKPTDTYSPVFAFMYIFNLIIGVGALSLPKAFSDAGLVLGTLLLIMLAFMSYMTATFMIEAMAIANALFRFKKRNGLDETGKLSSLAPRSSDIQKVDESSGFSGTYNEKKALLSHSPSPGDEKTPLVPPVISKEGVFSGSDSDTDDDCGPNYCIPPDDYEIDRKFEMGAMANLFYHPIGIFFYYLVICLYLYGDLAIYAVAIPKSLVTVVCYRAINFTDVCNMSISDCNFTANETNSSSLNPYCLGTITDSQAYYIFLTITVIVLCPWTFFNLSKSKYLQLVTTIMRNIAFVLMISIALSNLAQGHTADPSPPAATLEGFPILFGVSIYAFMCQHSLPGMITPMRKKRGVFVMIAVDFGLILTFYLLLTYTGAFWLDYQSLNSLYTLNFFRQFLPGDRAADTVLAVLGYYLALFPVFTLSTNFPIISITLRENLKALARVLLKRWVGERPFHWVIDRLFFPILAIALPIAIAFGTQNVQLLVSITGSFPGIGVQYVIPVTLAFCGKYLVSKKLNFRYENKYKSPFSYIPFLVFVLLWTLLSVALITADDILKIVRGTFLD